MLKYSSTPWVLILMFLRLKDLILKTAFQIWKRNFFNWNFTKKSTSGFEPGTIVLWIQHSTTELSWSLLKIVVPWKTTKILTATNDPKYRFNDLKKNLWLTKIIKISLYKYFGFQNYKLSLFNLVSRESITNESQE